MTPPARKTVRRCRRFRNLSMLSNGWGAAFASAGDPRPTVTQNMTVPSDTAVIDRHIQRADLILITHAVDPT
jgi:hypothetical protein